MDQDRLRRAMDRTYSAASRSEELRLRLERLRSGEPVCATDVAAAKSAAAQEEARIEPALRAAARAHLGAADAHRSAALRHLVGGREQQAQSPPERAAAEEAAAPDDLAAADRCQSQQLEREPTP